MTKLYDFLTLAAQQELLHDGMIEIVTVCVTAVPDPERPEDRLALKIVAEAGHDFREGIPWIDEDLDRIRKIARPAGEDLSIAARDCLLVELNGNRTMFDGLKEGKIGGHPAPYLSDPVFAELLRPMLENPTIEVMVWCYCWTLAMEDNGKLIVDAEPPRYGKGLDDESRARVNERIRQVDRVIGGMVVRGRGDV